MHKYIIMNGLLLYSEFIEQAKEFIELSNKFGDSWKLESNSNNKECGTYLLYNQKISTNFVSLTEETTSDKQNEIENQSNTEIINIQYHIIYSLSYQVPILFFKAYFSNGSIISLENAWKIFGNNFLSDNSNASKSDLYSILTQMDHPILFKPFLCLHPCRTNEILSNTPNSKNLIVTFISLMGPYVGLNLNESYGIHFK